MPTKPKDRNGPKGIYYLGTNSTGINILAQKVWVEGNTLNVLDRGNCKPIYDQSRKAINGSWVCTIGQLTLGPRDFCWSRISASSLQQWSVSKWVTLENGTASTQPWGSKDVWSCKSGFKAPSLEVRITEAAERWYRWKVNGETQEPFRVTFQN